MTVSEHPLEEEYSNDFQFVRINKNPICLNKNADGEAIVEDVAQLKGRSLLAINSSYLALALQNKLKLAKLSDFNEFLTTVNNNSNDNDEDNDETSNSKFDLGTDLSFDSEIIYITAFKNQFWLGLLNGDIFSINLEKNKIEKELILQLGEGEYKLSSDGTYCLKKGKLISLDIPNLTVVDEDVLDFEYKSGMCLAVLKKNELIIKRDDNKTKNIKLEDINIQDKEFYFVQILNSNSIQIFFTGLSDESDEENKKPDYQGIESVIIKLDDNDDDNLELIESNIIASADAFVESEFQTHAVEIQSFLKNYPAITIISSSRSTSVQLLTEVEKDGGKELLAQTATDDQFNIALPMNADSNDTTTKGLALDFWSKNTELASTLLQTTISLDVPVLFLLNSELELYCYLFVHLADYKAGQYNSEESRQIQESRLTIDINTVPVDSNEEQPKVEEINEIQPLEVSDDTEEIPPLDKSDNTDDEFEIIEEPKEDTIEQETPKKEETPKLNIFKSMENIVSKGDAFNKSFSGFGEATSKDSKPFSFGISSENKPNPFDTNNASPFATDNTSPFANFGLNTNKPSSGLSFADKFKSNSIDTKPEGAKESKDKADSEATSTPNTPSEQNMPNETTNLNTTYNTLDMTEDADDGSWVEVIDETTQQKQEQPKPDNNTNINSSLLEKDSSFATITEAKIEPVNVAEIKEKEVEVKPEIVSAGSQTEKEPRDVDHVSVFADEKLFKPKTLNEAYPYPVLEKLYAVDSEKVFNHKYENNDDAGLVVFGKIINIVENELRALKGNVKVFDKFVSEQSEKTFEKNEFEQLTDVSIHWRLGELNQFNKLLFEEFDSKLLDLTELKQKDENLTNILSQSFGLKNEINKILENLSIDKENSQKFTKPTNSEEGLLETNANILSINQFKLNTVEEILKLIKIYIACGKDLTNVEERDLEQYLKENKNFNINQYDDDSYCNTVKNIKPFNYNKKTSLAKRREILSRRENLSNILT